MDDIELLAQYARNHSEAAFATLVERHVNLVYSVALRNVGNPHAAEEITQAVFIILARKAAGWSQRMILAGWLYQTTRLTAANFLRGEIRRQKREQEAYMQSLANEPGPEVWPQIAPLLDDALGRLGERDRDAIVLRFFENKNLREVGAALGASEDAAKMRVSRALERLRKFFRKRGVSLTTTIIAGAISTSSVQAAPVALAKAVTAVAVAKGATAGGSTLTLIKGALKIMAWTNAKTAVVVGVGILFAAGTTTITVKEIQKHERGDLNWQTTGNLNSRWLRKAPPLLKIVPTRFPQGGGGAGVGDAEGNWRSIGLGYTVQSILEDAYQSRDSRTVFQTPLPKEKYDYIVTLPSEARQAFQNEIKRQFGVVGQLEMRETNVLLLKLKFPNVKGLKPSTNTTGYKGISPGRLTGTNQPLSELASMLEWRLGIPVMDRTDLTNHFDFNLTWDEYGSKVGNGYPGYPDLDGLKQALTDQFSLELVPTNMPIEMLVIEKAGN